MLVFYRCNNKSTPNSLLVVSIVSIFVRIWCKTYNLNKKTDCHRRCQCQRKRHTYTNALEKLNSPLGSRYVKQTMTKNSIYSGIVYFLSATNFIFLFHTFYTNSTLISLSQFFSQSPPTDNSTCVGQYSLRVCLSRILF